MKTLFFFVVSEISDDLRASMAEAIEQLKVYLQRFDMQPVFISETDEGSVTQPDDAPLESLGFEVQLEDAGPERPPRSAIAAVVAAAATISKDLGLELEIELDGVFCGDIVGGRISPTLQHGLLDEW